MQELAVKSYGTPLVPGEAAATLSSLAFYLEALRLIWKSPKKCLDHCLPCINQNQCLSPFGTHLVVYTHEQATTMSVSSTNGTALHEYYIYVTYQPRYSALARLYLKGSWTWGGPFRARTRGQGNMRDMTVKLLHHLLGQKVPLNLSQPPITPIFMLWLSLSISQPFKHKNSSTNSAFKIISFKRMHPETVTKCSTIWRYVFVIHEYPQNNYVLRTAFRHTPRREQALPPYLGNGCLVIS